jgi:hypothetical protein
MTARRNRIEWNHLQLRLPREIRTEISNLTGQLGVTAADVIRGALHFGLPVFAAMSGVQDEMVRRLVSELKGCSRGKVKKRRKGKPRPRTGRKASAI